MADTRRDDGERGRPLWRAAALGVVALVLAAQVAALALGTQERLWPFLRYEMYVRSGETRFSHRDLCVRSAGGATSVDHWDLAIPRWRFDHLLSLAGGDGPEAEPSRRLLSRQVGRVLGRHERLELWRRAYAMGPGGLVDAEPPWALERSWSAVPLDDVERIDLPDLEDAARIRAEACS